MIYVGIDPGAVSGWAIVAGPDRGLAYGTAKSAADRREAVERMAALGGKDRIVVAMEDWNTQGRISGKVILGMGDARGRWLEQLEIVLGVRARDVLRVQPLRWRAATHGVVKGEGETKHQRKKSRHGAAVAYAGVESVDAAEAVCIAFWAAREGLDQ